MKRMWKEGRSWQYVGRVCSAMFGILLVLFPPTALAQYSSNSYRMEEVQFGTGGDNLSSNTYKAEASAGALGVGSMSSASYFAEAGFLTPNEPFVEIIVNTSSVSLGVLDATATRTGTATFSVRAYVDSGYTVLAMGDPLTNEHGDALNTLTSPTASTVGTEQFGINLVKNTNFCGVGCDLGADPTLAPGSTFASGPLQIGQAATGYGTASQFKYVKGNTIAQTASGGWGKTDYTISYMANISSLTKSGSYTMKQDLVAVPTF